MFHNANHFSLYVNFYNIFFSISDICVMVHGNVQMVMMSMNANNTAAVVCFIAAWKEMS